MFSSRADELIRYSPIDHSKQSLQMPFREIPEKKRRPDRLIVFEETHSFESSLNHIARKIQDDAGSKIIRELVECTVLNHKGGGPLLFPFLVMEAKSEKGPSFSEIDTQTAFPIWKMLKIQEDLFEKTQKTPTYGGPLLWYIAYKGSEWRVSGCYTSLRDGKSSYVSSSSL